MTSCHTACKDYPTLVFNPRHPECTRNVYIQQLAEREMKVTGCESLELYTVTNIISTRTMHSWHRDSREANKRRK
jgi:hypothetical protein